MRLHTALPSFDEKGFIKVASQNLGELQFGERELQIRQALKDFLPDDYPMAVQIIHKALESPLTKTELTGLAGFINVPITKFVSDVGCTDENFDISMELLKELTKRFSSEWAIRDFIEFDEARSLQFFSIWVEDENVHVRRLVSEGMRPRLPLGSPLRKYKKDPTPILPFLHKLIGDPELYVRRSVANNLNDISKDNPQIVLDFLSQYIDTGSKEAQWVIKHALRTLLRRPHPDALRLLGYTDATSSSMQYEQVTHNLKIGENYQGKVAIQLNQPGRYLIDYVIHYVKANGKQRPKVFKIADKKFLAGVHVFKVTQSFAQMTTRRHYPGTHKIELRTNGHVHKQAFFDITS
jgi:3-methyladenine DNA glycosylase AlkC